MQIFKYFRKGKGLKNVKIVQYFHSEINFVYYLYSKVHFDDADGYTCILLSIW